MDTRNAKIERLEEREQTRNKETERNTETVEIEIIYKTYQLVVAAGQAVEQLAWAVGEPAAAVGAAVLVAVRTARTGRS